MIVAISIASASPDAALDPRFGRAAAFLLADTGTGQRRVVANPAASASGGAGVQAAEFVIRQGAQAVISGRFGPKASEVLAAAHVSLYRAPSGTANSLLRELQDGTLERVDGPTGAEQARSRR